MLRRRHIVTREEDAACIWPPRRCARHARRPPRSNRKNRSDARWSGWSSLQLLILVWRFRRLVTNLDFIGTSTIYVVGLSCPDFASVHTCSHLFRERLLRCQSEREPGPTGTAPRTEPGSLSTPTTRASGDCVPSKRKKRPSPITPVSTLSCAPAFTSPTARASPSRKPVGCG